MTPRGRIAVVGSGIAGLSAAWLLGKRHEVTLFERHARPGMGAFNLDIRDEAGSARIDVPLRVFKSVHYHNLMALYRAAGVAMQPTSHAATFTSAEGLHTYFRYHNLRFRNLSIPLITRLDRKTLSIARDTLRFMKRAPHDRAAGATAGSTLGAYLHDRGYGRDFVDGMLLPSLAAVCTCSYEAVRQYPADAIIDFFTSGRLFAGTWRARHGADDAIARLLQRSHEVRCDARVERIANDGEQMVLHQSDGSEDRFDHVVLAVQADQASQLIGEHDRESAALLRRVPYESSEVVVHGDSNLIPASARGSRSPVNFLVDAVQNRPMASICLNRIMPSLAGHPPLYQTWNPLVQPCEDSVRGRAVFDRPLVTMDSQAAMAALADKQRHEQRRVWYCGSFAMPGIPLLESAVQSAMLIAERLDAPVPWATALAR